MVEVNVVERNLKGTARLLRKNQTEAEKLIWSKLRNRQLEGMKFRRQRQIGRYIVDFVCLERKLIVEGDGSQHFESARDMVRDTYLREQGYIILRFWNNDILSNPEEVLQKITEISRVPIP